MEARKKKEAAEQAARLLAEKDDAAKQQMKDYQITNTLSRKFAKIRDGLSMLAP